VIPSTRSKRKRPTYESDGASVEDIPDVSLLTIAIVSEAKTATTMTPKMIKITAVTRIGSRPRPIKVCQWAKMILNAWK